METGVLDLERRINAFAALGEAMSRGAAGAGEGGGAAGEGTGTGEGPAGAGDGGGPGVAAGTSDGDGPAGEGTGTGEGPAGAGTEPRGAAGTAAALAGRFAELIDSLYLSNPWFTPDNARHAISSIARSLAPEKLRRWLSAYPETGVETEPVVVGVVMAGNIPLVGFHDLLCVLITGNRLQARLSTKDELSLRTVVSALTALEPGFKPYIELTSGRLQGFDRVIATGSNNTSRYFEYYFRNVPSIIRHNRNSVAILDGTETESELELLGDDIFSYFGLGCRNVSKIWVPAGYDIAALPSRWLNKYGALLSQYKYAVNLDHNKAIMIVNREPFIDAGFVLLKESESLIAPMAVLNYEYYDDSFAVVNKAKMPGESVQCIAGHGHLPFGSTQEPELWDYADNIDTIRFLQKKY